MTVFTDKIEATGIDLDTAKNWEKELRDKLQKAKTRLANANGSINSATVEKQSATDEIARLSAILGEPV